MSKVLSSYARQFLGTNAQTGRGLHWWIEPFDLHLAEVGRNQSSDRRSVRLPKSTITSGCCTHGWVRPIVPNATAQFPRKLVRRSSSGSSIGPHRPKLMVLAPLIRGQKGEYKDLFEDLLKQGFSRARVDGEVVSLSDSLAARPTHATQH